jgi:prophage DNA circulation protein
MSWRDRLKRAKWRELEFLTENHEAKEGQRLVVHELPGRDDPVVEDLGAKARSWRVSAYFIGADYDQGRDKLLALLRTPGAATLEHPWLGQVWVRW